ncbi:hypothetical protein KABACHOK_02430 [Brevundimonas phage vB_BpoS-Kabachok]|uniref:Uncharacterized protein n=1 Tax=Brevundimonas phage vB_BpoS-Kabachok TaxID=2948600 RepID=A0A9E7SK28_9CAUD|nr:hypothetical protein KABACHOK_02430 [Brevundimonas phage vB_BpoS-Kabachok]
MTHPAAPAPGTFRISRPWLKVSFHHHDWAPFLGLTRPATRWTRRARLLGVGFDINWDQSQRVYAVSLGANRLFNLAWAYQAGPVEDYGLSEALTKDRGYIQFDLLGLQLMRSKLGFRAFFLDRRLTPKRAEKVEATGVE